MINLPAEVVQEASSQVPAFDTMATTGLGTETVDPLEC